MPGGDMPPPPWFDPNLAQAIAGGSPPMTPILNGTISLRDVVKLTDGFQKVTTDQDAPDCQKGFMDAGAPLISDHLSPIRLGYRLVDGSEPLRSGPDGLNRHMRARAPHMPSSQSFEPERYGACRPPHIWTSVGNGLGPVVDGLSLCSCTFPPPPMPLFNSRVETT
jgi:hypothetical protein